MVKVKFVVIIPSDLQQYHYKREHVSQKGNKPNVVKQILFIDPFDSTIQLDLI